nr:uncharacterized protein LOC119179175 [Rhipicephalus microplus]
MTQEAAARMYGDLAGRTQVFTDEFILRDGFAWAACLSPQLDTDRQCRLWYCASSTTAELFGLLLAADLLRKSPAIKSAAIFCDSKPAPSKLSREERGPLLAQRVAHSLLTLQKRGCDLVLQWLPSRVSIAGNEAADELAKRAHPVETPLIEYASSLDSACEQPSPGANARAS